MAKYNSEIKHGEIIMKRKLKDFLNRRVISTAISAAITFNMAALFPVSVFAKDDNSTHTNTIDLSEVKIDGKVMSNGYIAFNIENDGHFAIGTTGGDPDNSKDNNKKMLYGFSSGSTSYSTLRIDGASYIFNASNNSFNANEANNVAEATYNDVDIQQILSLTNNPATGRADLIEVKYVVTNESESEKNVGLRIMMDTMLGDNDSAPFRIPQYGAITTETEYTGDEIPQFWQAFDNLTSPSVIAQGRLYQTEEDKPDKVQFCKWRGLSNCNWEYTTHPGSGNGDSGVAMTWYEAPLAPYESKEYVTYYGLSEFSEDMSLPLGLSVYSDSELSVVNNQYAPNPVDVTAYIQNLSSNTAKDVKVSIELPDGLQLINNSEQTIDIGEMTPNQLEQTVWNVFVNPSSEERTYEYTVVLTAADGYEKRVSRKIHVPNLKVEEVSPYTIFSGSSTENFQLNCWKSTFNGSVYTGSGFISNASELYLNGKVDAVNSIITNGWKINIDERNENVEKEAMPDWDERIHKMAGAYEYTEDNIVRIEDRNVISGAVKTTGNVEISGTTFDGNCYIIADGDITYNVNDFISTGRVVLYSRNGNIKINGTNINMNGIIYAPNGTVAFNSNIADINGRIFADKINFSGSIFNVTGSDSDWELLGTKTLISKTYTFDGDFNEGEFDGLGLDVADELTLNQRSGNDIISAENSYKIDGATNGINLTVKSEKSSLDKPEDSINLQFDLSGFGSQEIEENNVDLAIVVDTSGSMSGVRRTNAQNAAREVVAQLKENDRCAIIKFSSSATVLQDFTDDYELLDTAINKFGSSGGTNIASGINKAIGCFGNLEDNSRQKYIILLSDGGDSSKSAQAALDAYALGIRIFALSIGNDSNQMQTVAANSNGIYLNSPTAEQINEMMQQFAAEVFDTAGKDVSLEMTVSKKADIDTSAILPNPTEIVENEDGTKTLKWNYEKISIDESQKITVPVSVTDLKSGLVNIADNVSCTFFNRNGESSTVYADDIVMPVHSYKESGTWTAVYDSKTVNTVWKNIYWNGKLYDDGKTTVRACAGNDENAFSDWIDITNHADIENLSGRYIKLSVEMNVSSTGKTPELFDITLLSDGADKVNYVNNAPQTKIIGSDTTCVSKRLFLSSETMDDAFCNQLNFKWSCNNENVIISSPNKPYTSFEFNESGEYEVTIIVSDGNSETIVSQMITVLNDEVMVIPIVDLEIPSIVKAGSTVNGKVNNLNSSQISEYEIKVGNDSVSADEDGNFTFTAPENDCIISINVKAINALGLYGESSKAIVIDGTAPSVELKSDSDEIHTNDTVTISALMSDENGINDYSLTLNGEEVTLNENYQYIFAPENVGEHVFTLTVEDIVGNISDTTLVLNVSEKEIKDTNQPVVEYSVPKMLMVGESGEFKFIASDDTGVAEFTVAVNGSVITLDENDCFSFISEEIGNLIIDVHAADEACNNTDFQLIVPVISFDLVTEKTTYKENELVNVQLVYSDNLNIINQQVTIDGVQMTVENDKISVEGLLVGTHQLVWQIQDECGAVFTGILEINIVDSTAPEISVTLSNNNPKERETVTAEITAKDEHGVASITANLDGKEISVIDNKAVLENLTAGKHTFKVTATDTSGNYAVYTCNFTVLSSQPIDTIAPDLDIAVELTEDKKIEIIAVAVDNSGTATITGTVNGEEVIFENHVAIYTPNEAGDYVIFVRAEDESGNYTEKTQTVTITEEDLMFELKLGVNVEKNIIKPNEKTDLVVSTSSMLGEVSLSCTSDGGTITENENGFSFSSDKTGTFEVVVTATDKIGNTASKSVYITVTEDEPDIDDEEYVNNINIEPRARIVLKSDELAETKMTEEMAELADQLKTPLAVYEYLYNNLNAEFYTSNRKGAIGTYEQNGGSDIDCSSLLIAMLRYLGYDADYVTGRIGLNAQQLIELTATDDIETALKIFSMSGKQVTKTNNTYYFNHTWVKTNINNIDYELDVYFKKYDHVGGISDIAAMKEVTDAAAQYKDPADIYAITDQFTLIDEKENIYVTGKTIHQKKISSLPLTLPFICDKIVEEIHDIVSSKIVITDGILLGFNGKYQQKIRSAELYYNTISIGYVPCEELYDLYDEPTPSSIYNLSQDYISSVTNTIAPVLFVNNKKYYEWAFSSTLTRLGKTQELSIAVVSDGHTYEDTKELLVGSLNAIVLDAQNISPQSLLTALSRLPETEEEKGKLSENNFFKDEYAGNFLQLLGNTYFAEYDIQSKILAGVKDVYAERELSYGFVSYIPDITERFSQVSISKNGSFQFDIMGNIRSCVSYNGSDEDIENWRFADGYTSSLLESEVLEQLVGIESVSTAAVLAEAEDNNIDIIMISSKNADAIDSLQLSSKDIQEIRNEVNAGNTVITPCKNINLGSWTGTGYIVKDEGQGTLSFKLSNGLNGGSTIVDIVPLMFLDAILSGAELAGAISAIVSSLSALLAASAFLPGLGAAVVLVLSVVSLYCIIDHMLTVQALWEEALDGNQAAIEQIKWECGFNLLISAATFGLCKGASAIANKAAAKTLTKYLGEAAGEDAKIIFKDNLSAAARFAKRATKQGIDSATLKTLMRSPRCLGYSKNVLKALGDLDILVRGDVADILAKNADDLVKAFGKSGLVDDAVKFIARNGDDAAEVFIKHGDDAINAVIKCADEKAAINVIKNYGDDAVRIIDDYAENGVNALKNGISPKQIDELKSVGIYPKDYNKTGCIRNLEIGSSDAADSIINANKTIHSIFSDEEIKMLKEEALRLENNAKSSMSKTQLGPATATVYYKNAPAGESPYVFAVNQPKGKSALQLNPDGVRVDIIDDGIDALKTNPEYGDILAAAQEVNGGVGSHAEVNAVRQAMEKFGSTNPDDYLVYVNYTNRSLEIAAEECPFFTCAHCEFILKDFHILSNVENLQYN